MLKNRFVLTALAAGILAIPTVAADAPGYFKVPGTETTLKVYGQIQLREGFGLNGNGMSDVTGYIPTAADGNHSDDWQQSGQWSGSWRYYQGVSTTTPSELGDVKTTIYGRFNHGDSKTVGQSVNFNLEQAFVQIGGLKVGTDWSLFGMNAWEPNTLFGCVADEDGSWENSRQINYTFTAAPGLDLAVGLEAANCDTAKGTTNATAPSFVAVASFSQDWGGVTAAVNYQQKKDWAKNAVKNATGTGTSWILSGGYNVTKNDQVTVMILNGGEGVGSSNDGFYTQTNGDYGFYKSLAMNACYSHTWNDKFSSSLVVDQIKWDKDDAQAALANGAYPKDNYKATEVIVNTTWQATKTVSLGVEYQHGQLKADNNEWIDSTSKGVNKCSLDSIRLKLKATLW